VSNTATAKTNGAASTEKDAKMEVMKPEVKKEPRNVGAVLSLEKRIQRVQELSIVIDKWRKLNDARNNLQEFSLGNDGMNSGIILRDASGREFKTNQPIVYAAVLRSIKEVLDEKIAETEAQINFAD
jgi:hypothetical protein